jgi:dihydrofolate reductase
MTLIVAKNRNNGIGYKNELLFRIPEDMRFFRETTTEKTVVVGHSTLKSFKDGKPLPNRRTIVLSRDRGLKIQNAEVCNSVEELFELLKNDGIDSPICDKNNRAKTYENGGIEPRICGENNRTFTDKNDGIEPSVCDKNNRLKTNENDGIEPCVGQVLTANENVFIIGGGAVYELLKDYCKYALVTEVDDGSPADAFINFIEPPRWTLLSRSEKKEFEGIEYSFCKYENNCVKQPNIKVKYN